MTDFFDALEQQLREAPRPEAEAIARSPWWRRRRTLSLLALISVVGVGSPAVARVTGVWAPERDTPRRPARTVTANVPAPQASAAGASITEFTCVGDPGPGPTTYTDSPTDPALLAILSVLRAPATAADRLARSRLSRTSMGLVNPAAIRVLGTAGGKTYYAIPARGKPAPLIKDCLERLSPSDRREALRLSAERRHRLAQPHLCVQTRSGGGCSATASTLAAAGAHGSAGGNERSVHWGVVPDGVSSVRVRYSGESRTFPVRRNFYSFEIRRGADETPTQVTWVRTDGTTKVVPRR
ncbi:hypothetical protein DSM112329_02864 [Paraconexibacter sp. AEG42_29]|uniref:Uncharacterized protein n=1 Tax=Paraconexibacter sp. AEG42_29 TaxID=2997339 RepID=A0AAU7AWD8_9ACTN